MANKWLKDKFKNKEIDWQTILEKNRSKNDGIPTEVGFNPSKLPKEIFEIITKRDPKSLLFVNDVEKLYAYFKMSVGKTIERLFNIDRYIKKLDKKGLNPNNTYRKLLGIDDFNIDIYTNTTATIVTINSFLGLAKNVMPGTSFINQIMIALAKNVETFYKLEEKKFIDDLRDEYIEDIVEEYDFKNPLFNEEIDLYNYDNIQRQKRYTLNTLVFIYLAFGEQEVISYIKGKHNLKDLDIKYKHILEKIKLKASEDYEKYIIDLRRIQEARESFKNISDLYGIDINMAISKKEKRDISRKKQTKKKGK